MNPHSQVQTQRLVIRWDGQKPTDPIVRAVLPGGREAYWLRQWVPGPGNYNGTVEVSCEPDGCPSTVSVYADELRRGTVASHPAIEWECVFRP